ncbi:MAG: pentapeptide repeat-containing protein [Acidobacteriota bacterium]
MAVYDPVAEVEELKSEIERLRGELTTRNRRQKQLAYGAIGVGGQLLLGRDLVSSFRAWLEAKSLRNPLPSDETSAVFAAIVRRGFRVGMFAIVLAVVPAATTSGFLYWQSLIMKEQNTAIRRQLDLQQQEIERQTRDTRVARRARLLETFYDEDCRDVEADRHEAASRLPTSSRICRPRANARARQEAAIAYSRLELSVSRPPSLANADLAMLDFFQAGFNESDLRAASFHAGNLREAGLAMADLSGADLSLANLNWADLREANLAGADLKGASLMVAILLDANLATADLSGAILGGADLRGASFRAAKLAGADLAGANLLGARNLTQEQVNSAEGDSETRLPVELAVPGRWKAGSR